MRAVRGWISQVVFSGSSGGVGVTDYSTTPYTASRSLTSNVKKMWEDTHTIFMNIIYVRVYNVYNIICYALALHKFILFYIISVFIYMYIFICIGTAYPLLTRPTDTAYKSLYYYIHTSTTDM